MSGDGSEISHVHVVTMTPPSGSFTVARRAVPTCGCSEEKRSSPASSTLVIVTVTCWVVMLVRSPVPLVATTVAQ